MAYDVMIPGLLPPIEPAAIPEILADLELLGLRRLLDATVSAHNPIDVDTWLCEAFNVKASPDYPMAALARFATDPDMPNDCWMHADPVHISVRRDQLLLIGPQALSITDAELDALKPTLQQEVPAGYDWEFASASSWFLRGAEKPDTRTITLGQVEGRAISHALPHGPDAAQWRRVMTELQMALHQHEVNLAREARGELPINGVWIWGIGKLPETVQASYAAIWSDRALAAGLARCAGIQHHAVPADFPSFGKVGGQQLLILDALETPTQYADWAAWRDAIEKLDAQWLRPLSEMASSMQVLLPGQDRLLTLRPRPRRPWQFWRKVQPAAEALHRLITSQ